MLHHPYYIYHQEITSNYRNYEMYNNELVRLSEYLDNVKIDRRTLINIVIGTPMEDMNYRGKLSNKQQYTQILGKYIYDYMEYVYEKSEDSEIEIIVISPDDIFRDEYELMFMSQEYIKFVKIDNKKYEYEYKGEGIRIVVRINIFNCPMPHRETRESVIIKYNEISRKLGLEYDFRQTEEDEEYIRKFYEKIERMMKDSKYMIISSYAVFNNLERTTPYMMFKEMMDLGIKYDKILLEWIWNEENMFSKLISMRWRNRYVIYNDIEYGLIDRYYADRMCYIRYSEEGVKIEDLW